MQGGGRSAAVQLGRPAAPTRQSPPAQWHDEIGRREHLAAEVRRVQGDAPGRLVDPAQVGKGELVLAERGGQRGPPPATTARPARAAAVWSAGRSRAWRGRRRLLQPGGDHDAGRRTCAAAQGARFRSRRSRRRGAGRRGRQGPRRRRRSHRAAASPPGPPGPPAPPRPPNPAGHAGSAARTAGRCAGSAARDRRSRQRRVAPLQSGHRRHHATRGSGQAWAAWTTGMQG
jgi:hypothetical protein